MIFFINARYFYLIQGITTLQQQGIHTLLMGYNTTQQGTDTLYSKA